MSSIHNVAQFVVIEMEPVYVPYAVPIYVPYASFKHGLALDFPEEAITAMKPESVERVVTLKGELEELMTSLEKRRAEMCRVLAVHGGDRVYGARSAVIDCHQKAKKRKRRKVQRAEKVEGIGRHLQNGKYKASFTKSSKLGKQSRTEHGGPKKQHRGRQARRR